MPARKHKGKPGAGGMTVHELANWLQDHLLDQTVYSYRNSQLALSSARLRDLHSTHGLGNQLRHAVRRLPNHWSEPAGTREEGSSGRIPAPSN
jgi:hypothetical protein